MAKKRNARISKTKAVVKKEQRKNYISIILIFFIIFGIFAVVYPYIGMPKIEYKKVVPAFISMENATLVSMNIPAVSSDGKGVSTLLSVEAMPGSGRILLDINNLLFWADTEHSMRKARLVAANITEKDINKYDLIYNIYANASVIGGESAGAALTIATIAALENKTPSTKVMITGVINRDGSIGPVGGILEKAQAAKGANATLLLVPLLQSRDVVYETKKSCEKFGWTEICTEEQIPQKIRVSDKAGIEVTEVDSVREAMKYFFE